MIVKYTDVPMLDTSAVYIEEKDELVIFALNRDQNESLALECDVRGFEGFKVVEHIVMHHDDVKATNTEANPYNVVPNNNGNAKVDEGILTASLSNLSWNVIRLAK